jgi:cytidylate kinase
MKKTPRTFEELIAGNVEIWNRKKERRADQPYCPVIAITRLPGCGSGRIAKQVAETLGFDLIGRELIERIAKDAKIRQELVAALDEKGKLKPEDWVAAQLEKRYFWKDEYLLHLSSVVTAIATHGHAVLLGRGASFILPPEDCLRILLVAPLEARMARAKRDRRLSAKEARAYVVRVESERRSFIERYFHTDMTDPAHFDLSINTADLGDDAAANIVVGAWKAKQTRPKKRS